MARTNYTYEKRQKELAKKQKKEEKRLKKLEQASAEAQPDQPPLDSDSGTSVDSDT